MTRVLPRLLGPVTRPCYNINILIRMITIIIIIIIIIIITLMIVTLVMHDSSGPPLFIVLKKDLKYYE